MIATLLFRLVVLTLAFGIPVLLVYQAVRLEVWELLFFAAMFAAGFAAGRYR